MHGEEANFYICGKCAPAKIKEIQEEVAAFDKGEAITFEEWYEKVFCAWKLEWANRNCTYYDTLKFCWQEAQKNVGENQKSIELLEKIESEKS